MATRIALFLMCLGVSQAAYSQDVPLRQCQKLKDAIEQYDELRRQGGRASAMDNWKRQRREKDEAFRRYGCREYEDELQ
jgi:hypothetical protein